MREVKDGGEHCLHDRDDQPPVDDELSQFGRTPVRVSTVPHEQFGQMAELDDGEVRGERSLFALFSDDTDTYDSLSAEIK